MEAIEGAAVAGRVADVLLDVRSFAERGRVRPLVEGEAEGRHVGIGTDARIAEGVPGAADVTVHVMDFPSPCRESLGDVMGEVDSRDARSDDEQVKGVFLRSGGVGNAGRSRSHVLDNSALGVKIVA